MTWWDHSKKCYVINSQLSVQGEDCHCNNPIVIEYVKTLSWWKHSTIFRNYKAAVGLSSLNVLKAVEYSVFNAFSYDKAATVTSFPNHLIHCSMYPCRAWWSLCCGTNVVAVPYQIPIKQITHHQGTPRLCYHWPFHSYVLLQRNVSSPIYHYLNWLNFYTFIMNSLQDDYMFHIGHFIRPLCLNVPISDLYEFTYFKCQICMLLKYS